MCFGKKFVLASYLSLFACTSETPVCEPGSTQKCYCPDGSISAQTCEAGGATWLACQCSSTQPLDAGNGLLDAATGIDQAVPGVPNIQVLPAAFLFGDVEVGETAEDSVTLSNEGWGTLNIVDLQMSGDFCFDRSCVLTLTTRPQLPFQVHPDEEQIFDVKCSPPARATYSGVLRVVSDDPDTPILDVGISCTGHAEAPVALARVVEFSGLEAGSQTIIHAGSAIIVNASDSFGPNSRYPVASYAWRFLAKPAASTAEFETPSAVSSAIIHTASGSTTHGLDLAGGYRVELTVTDIDGVTGSSEITFVVTPAPVMTGVAVLLSWDHASADLDLHFIRNGGAAFTTDDCYYANCRGPEGLDWGGGSPNPHLLLRADNGYGPELISAESLLPGDYRFAVHYFSVRSGQAPLTADLTVFVDGVVARSWSNDLTACNQFWEAASISMPSQEITDINDTSIDTHGSCR